MFVIPVDYRIIQEHPDYAPEKTHFINCLLIPRILSIFVLGCHNLQRFPAFDFLNPSRTFKFGTDFDPHGNFKRWQRRPSCSYLVVIRSDGIYHSPVHRVVVASKYGQFPDPSPRRMNSLGFRAFTRKSPDSGLWTVSLHFVTNAASVLSEITHMAAQTTRNRLVDITFQMEI